MPNNESIKKSRVAIGAVQLAALYLPAHFLNMLLLYSIDVGIIISLFIVPVFIGGLSSIAVCSSSKVEALFKWVFSIPVSIVFWLLMVNMEFRIRALNWIFPDYGASSAGGNFVEFIILSITSAFILLSIIIGILMSCKKEEERIYLYKQICSIICGAILLSILILNFIMPQYTYGLG